MCGRFTLTADPADLQEAFYWVNFGNASITPRYNIAPTQGVAVVPNNGQNTLDFFTWGLVPSWAKDPSIGSRMINARSETIQEKPSYRNAFRQRRCLILADGFYEWQKQSGSAPKLPFYFQLADGAPFAFAGIWETWNPPEGEPLRSCSIITTEPNDLVAMAHNRMPVIFDKGGMWDWLAEKPADALQAMLAPYPAEKMRAHPVGLAVNNPKNDSAQCVQEITA